jgi:hypothetical protein
MYFIDCDSLSSLGNKNFKNGIIFFVRDFINPEFSAIFIIPAQTERTPNIVKQISTDSRDELITAEVIPDRFPENAENNIPNKIIETHK